ncbi:MAG TPA: class I SAM-dependent methyltransferase [Candidatus Limnocylindrales bacterium]|nr:class I SAM-dependent methyltransferase [Candidatus Limnocylindrales bacterium]
MTSTCGACGSDLEPVLALGEQPLANALLTLEALGEPEPRFPLTLAICPKCGLVQITDPVAPERMFLEYAYFSSVSDAFVEHAKALANRLIATRGLTGTSLVLEVASNDGYLLRHYADAGIPILGVDPARNVAEVARSRGVPTLTEFFDLTLAEDLRASGRAADIVHANNVIAHVPDLDGFVAGIAAVLKPTGVAVIETPYVRDLVERLEFDTIYHEHRYYHSLTALTPILERHGLVVADVERLPVHGGSLRIFAVHRDAPEAAIRGLRSTTGPAMLAEEQGLGLADRDYYRDFAARVECLGADLRDLLDTLKGQGQSIAAYGAAAKGTVLLNAFKIGADSIDFVADRSPHKQGRFMPGVRIPIVPAERLVEAMPHACLLLAWNFADEILAQQQDYRDRGGRFIIPVPQPELV